MELKDIEKISNWIKNYVYGARANGVILGMSGGKDSFVTAALCIKALGKDKVLGIIMPNGKMKDITVAIESCKQLGMRYYIVDINNIYNNVIDNIDNIILSEEKTLSSVTTINTPPRLRMVTLYAIAGSLNYLVANTSNLSEAMVGYTTKWGDNVGDFSPLANFTKNEVCEIGLLLGLDEKLVNKVPDDGLSGQSDEEKLGFSYDELDEFIRKGKKADKFEIISSMHKSSCHKRTGVVKYESKIKNYFDDERDM